MFGVNSRRVDSFGHAMQCREILDLYGTQYLLHACIPMYIVHLTEDVIVNLLYTKNLNGLSTFSNFINFVYISLEFFLLKLKFYSHS